MASLSVELAAMTVLVVLKVLVGSGFGGVSRALNAVDRAGITLVAARTVGALVSKLRLNTGDENIEKERGVDVVGRWLFYVQGGTSEVGVVGNQKQQLQAEHARFADRWKVLAGKNFGLLFGNPCARSRLCRLLLSCVLASVADAACVECFFA